MWVEQQAELPQQPEKEVVVEEKVTSLIHTLPAMACDHCKDYQTPLNSVERVIIINYSRTSAYRHFYFNRIDLLYNAIHSVINLSDSYNTIKCKIIAFLWSYYESKFDPHDT